MEAKVRWNGNGHTNGEFWNAFNTHVLYICMIITWFVDISDNHVYNILNLFMARIELYNSYYYIDFIIQTAFSSRQIILNKFSYIAKLINFKYLTHVIHCIVS